MDEMAKCGEVEFTEFFLPDAIPEFCTGCQLCLGNPYEKCPHSRHTKPIIHAILESDALLFATPHHGGCAMSAGMKNLLDHLDFLTMAVAPRKEIFGRKAYIISTATGSTAAIRPIRKFLKNWGINRIGAMGIRMFVDKWERMKPKKQERVAATLRKNAQKFYRLKKKRPYFTSVFMYYMFRWIVKKYIGEGNYPYEYWKEHGYLTRRPF
jgi:multimeric flavodoxin WrbA